MKLLELYKDKIIGVVKGLDRVRFRGTIRWLASQSGFESYWCQTGLLLKEFSDWAQAKTKCLRESCKTRADFHGIETRYLQTSAVNKEKLARQIAEEKGIRDGSICMFSVVEQCYSPTVVGNKETKHIEMRVLPRKCVWVYHYFDHPVYGFGHVRLQTWLPMNVFICLNGRHWLEKQMRTKRMSYMKDGNTFPWIANLAGAQELMNDQLRSDWPNMLNQLVWDTCPALGEVLAPLRPEYYWSADDTEWATDVMFRSVGDLEKLYPSFIRNAMINSDSPAVMRYFGKRNLTSSGKCFGKMPEEVISDFRSRYEGMRAKHWLNGNSVKVYDKQGSILRFETTITNTRGFKVFRRPDDDPNRLPSWQRMRKGVADLYRRCELSDQCNTRYADSIAASLVADTLKEVVQEACNPVRKKGKKCRGLNPWNTEDYKLLTFLAKGELAINGFRNKDLREHLYSIPASKDEKRKKQLSGKTSRRIRMLRMHGLVRKVPRENRYVLTAKGQNFSTALMSASSTSIEQLMDSAS